MKKFNKEFKEYKQELKRVKEKKEYIMKALGYNVC